MWRYSVRESPNPGFMCFGTYAFYHFFGLPCVSPSVRHVFDPPMLVRPSVRHVFDPPMLVRPLFSTLAKKKACVACYSSTLYILSPIEDPERSQSNAVLS